MMTFNSNQNRQKIQNTKRRETSLLKEQVRNADLYKSVLNKIMTTHAECTKYNSVTPLKFSVRFQ